MTDAPERRLPDDVSPLGWRATNALFALGGVVGAAGFVLLVGAALDPPQFFHSYLFGYTFALDVCLGALFWVLVHHVADAGWSVGLRRTFENLTRPLAPLALLFVPVAVGISTDHLHKWHEFVSGPRPDGPAARQWDVKATWFAPAFFLGRVALYFAVWLLYSLAMRGWSARQDAAGGAALTRRMQWWAPSGLGLLGLTSTFFAVDLLMSLQYTWFSTIFGVYFWVGGIRGSLSTAVLLVLGLRAAGRLRNTVTVEHLHDAAKLMFGFTVFWAYIAFAQYFLIWYANVPEETQFYLLRQHGAWRWLSYALPVLNFVVPFFLLLPRANKRNPTTLAVAAGWVLAVHAVDLYWQILPVLHPDTIHVHWLDVAAPVALFGVVGWSAVRGYQRLPLIPVGDARLNETIGYENETP